MNDTVPETKPVFDVDYYIGRCEALPESEWCTGTVLNAAGQCCVIGHFFHDGIDGLSRAFKGVLDLSLVKVNDGEEARYQQPTPKQRILAALRDIKAANETQNQS
jgi:hypothetical protein